MKSLYAFAVIVIMAILFSNSVTAQTVMAAEPQSAVAVAIDNPSVPAACAAFQGVWKGRWGSSYGGDFYLRVESIDAACTVKYSYGGDDKIPPGFKEGFIKNGELSFPCGAAATCMFELHGSNELYSRYLGFQYRNTGVFTKLKKL